MIEINFITFITPIHHHPCSVKSVPSYSDWGQCLAGGKAVLRLPAFGVVGEQHGMTIEIDCR